MYKEIIKLIKKYDSIVIARHIGGDIDALGSQIGLKEIIKETYPNKKVYAVGAYASRFKFVGPLDKEENIDFCIANGENASGAGITKSDYDRLIDAGVDVITLGNHTFGKKDVFSLLENSYDIIRPANYPQGVAGRGYGIYKRGNKKIHL